MFRFKHSDTSAYTSYFAIIFYVLEFLLLPNSIYIIYLSILKTIRGSNVLLNHIYGWNFDTTFYPRNEKNLI